MLTRLRRRAEAMFLMAEFKVKVILRGQMAYYFFPFRSITLESLEGLRRNVTQMFTRLIRRAEAMFWMAGFNVKVILRGQRPYDFFPFRSVTLEALEGLRRNLTQMFTRLRRRAEAMFRMAGFKVKVILRGQRPYTFFPFHSVTLEGFRRNRTQMLTRLRQCAEAMFRIAGF